MRLISRMTGPFGAISYVVCSTPLALLVGLLLGRFGLPVVQALVIFPLFVLLVRHQKWRLTVIAMLLWAALSAVLSIWLSFSANGLMADRVLLGPAYRREMFDWIATGVGKEGNIRLFLPEHILHFVLFCILTSFSAGLLGLIMGSVLMNYMSFYVGSLLLVSTHPWQTILLAWPPWAAVRVSAFILVAVALAALVLERVGLMVAHFGTVRRLLAAGLVLLTLDVGLKWWLAPHWQKWLQEMTQL